MRPKTILPDAMVARAADQIRMGCGITTVAANCGVAHGTLRANFARFEKFKDLAERPKATPREPKNNTPEPKSSWDSSAANHFLRIPLRT
jgi:hypothetical protein